MDFIPAKCPNCGGDLMLPKAKDDAICTYCGTKFLLKDATPKTPSPTIENWLLLAQTALTSGNSKEAYDFYTRILEVDSNNVTAWIGKGTSAGWQSTLGDSRIIEMLNCYSKALEYASENEQVELKTKIASAASDVLTALTRLMMNHLIEHITVDSSWSDFISNSKTVFDAVDYVLDLAPQNPVAAFVGVWITTRLINGVDFRDYNNVTRTRSVSEQSKQNLIPRRQKYVNIVKAADPTLDVPEIQKKPVKKGWFG